MEKQAWSELIPFYLNGTLNDTERRQFEQQLLVNPDWNREIEAWRVLADAVYVEASQRAKKLPPISEQVRGELAGGQPIASIPMPDEATRSQLRVVEPPAEQKRKNDHDRRRMTNVVGAFVTLAAAVAVLVTAGLIMMALNTPTDGEDGTPEAIALAGTEANATVTAEAGFGAPGNPPEVPGLPTAQFPPTATPLVPPNPPVELEQLPRGGGNGGIVDSQPAPGSGGGSNGGAVVQVAPTRTIAAATQSGNCYVELPVAAAPLPIYQFADTSSDVLGLMQPGQRFDTWINTPKNGGGAFYQVFLPESSTRLGWVDGLAVTLYGPDGTTNCQNMLNPTPTNPAFPGNLPTPFPNDNICRVSSAIGTSFAALRSPELGSGVVGTYGFGDLAQANQFYTENGGWYQVIVFGTGFGWVPAEIVVENGNCAGIPRVASIAPATEPPVIPPTATLSATNCRVRDIPAGEAVVRQLPGINSGIEMRVTIGDLQRGTWYVTAQTGDNSWYRLTEDVNGMFTNRGWVSASDVLGEGSCGTQPVISATDVFLTAQPSPTLPPAGE